MHTPAPRALAPRTSAVTYPGATEHIRVVRADLRAVLHECPMADDVILCASELAANAAVHSRSCLSGGTFTVRAKISPGNYVWIEVEDDGGHSAPRKCGSAGHHGLDIVRALATDWGINGDHTTRTIWARFDWSDRL
jgi:serine/threonine-protein kinase RsbW